MQLWHCRMSKRPAEKIDCPVSRASCLQLLRASVASFRAEKKKWLRRSRGHLPGRRQDLPKKINLSFAPPEFRSRNRCRLCDLAVTRS